MAYEELFVTFASNEDYNSSDIAWARPDYVYSNDGNFATARFLGELNDNYTDYIYCSSISDSSIGTNNTIDTVRVYISLKRDASISQYTDIAVQFYDGTTLRSTNYIIDSIPTTEGFISVVSSYSGWTGAMLDNIRLKVRAFNVGSSDSGFISVDFIFVRVDYTPWVAPSAPADPSITADGVGDATVSSASPSDGGASLDNVHHQISKSSTFASGNIDYYKGSAPTDPQTHQFTGLDADGLYYARARYHNVINWGAYNSSPYNSDRIWDQSNAPAWASPKFAGRSTTAIIFDWITPTDLGNSNLIEYDYQWKIDGGTLAVVDTNSTNTIATKGSLVAGTKYWFQQRAVTQWGDGVLNSLFAHWTLCATPVISSVVANAVGQLRVSWTTVTGVSHWELEKSPTGTGDWSTVDLSIPPDTLFKDVPGLGNGALWYFRLRAENADGNDSANSTNGSATTWDVPDNQDLVSATTPNPSMIRITRNGTYPDGNGEAVDSWEVWRCATAGGTYLELETGITATTYDDLTAKSGETWYYKAKFTNLVGDSALSTNYVNVTVTLGYQSYHPSNLRIKAIGQQVSLSSNLIVRIIDQQISLPSQLKVQLQFQLFKSSNLRIRVVDNQIYLSSRLSVQIEWRAAFTPTVTFSRYELNDGVVSTIDDDIDFGEWEGTKTMTAIAVDPYENSMVNPDKHEFYYTVDPESGHENFYQVPLTNGLLSIDDATSGTVYEVGYRGIGYDQQIWTSGSTEIIALIDVDGDWAGSGSRTNLTGAWSNTGTVWSPPSASGTNVLDVPIAHNGCCMVVVQPSDWDGNTDHKLHDWLPLQVSVGHAVEVKDYAEFYSGTHEDSEINLQGYINANGTPYDISFKVYHERPKEWEWYSGAIKIDSGTLTTNKDTWQMLDNLNMGATHLSGTTTFSLKLFANSGSVLHPNPVRVITVNRII